IVFVIHGRATIHAYVESFVDGDEEWRCVRDFLGRDFLAIHTEGASTALAETGAIVLEVECEGVLAGSERLLPLPPEAFQTDEIVEKYRFSFKEVQTVAAETATQCYEHSLAAALRNVHLGSDGVGLVQNASRIALRQTGNFTRVAENVPSSGCTR